MKSNPKSGQKPSSFPTPIPDARDIAAIKHMTKNLVAEHRRWNMPLLTWKNGKVVGVKP